MWENCHDAAEYERTMTTRDEAFVRAHWNIGRVASFARLLVSDSWIHFDSWAAAAEFTRKRLEEIQQLNNDLATIRVDLGFAKTDHTRRVYSHVVSLLESTFNEKTDGMCQLPS